MARKDNPSVGNNGSGKAKAVKKVGRPTDYCEKTITTICTRAAQGESLVSIVKSPGMPDYTTVTRWLRKHEEFRLMYTQAKEDAAEVMADQLLEIADELPPMTPEGRYDAAAVNHARLRVDTRKWIAAKLKPRKYGDRVSTELSGNVSASITIMTGVPSGDN